MKLGARELRELDEVEIRSKLRKLKRRSIYFILEDVLDTYNVGGLFRLADALAIEKLYLCGQTETPPNHRIKKASVGTYKVVAWEYKKSAIEAISELRMTNDELRVIAIEQDKKAIDYRRTDYLRPVAFVVGNETSGISDETLSFCNQIVEIPMWGVNKSLNVIVSAAIVAYHAIKQLQA